MYIYIICSLYYRLEIVFDFQINPSFAQSPLFILTVLQKCAIFIQIQSLTIEVSCIVSCEKIWIESLEIMIIISLFQYSPFVIEKFSSAYIVKRKNIHATYINLITYNLVFRTLIDLLLTQMVDHFDETDQFQKKCNLFLFRSCPRLCICAFQKGHPTSLKANDNLSNVFKFMHKYCLSKRSRPNLCYVYVIYIKWIRTTESVMPSENKVTSNIA